MRTQIQAVPWKRNLHCILSDPVGAILARAASSGEPIQQMRWRSEVLTSQSVVLLPTSAISGLGYRLYASSFRWPQRVVIAGYRRLHAADADDMSHMTTFHSFLILWNFKVFMNHELCKKRFTKKLISPIIFYQLAAMRASSIGSFVTGQLVLQEQQCSFRKCLEFEQFNLKDSNLRFSVEALRRFREVFYSC